jgi:hypothetical protein
MRPNIDDVLASGCRKSLLLKRMASDLLASAPTDFPCSSVVAAGSSGYRRLSLFDTLPLRPA